MAAGRELAHAVHPTITVVQIPLAVDTYFSPVSASGSNIEVLGLVRAWLQPETPEQPQYMLRIVKPGEVYGPEVLHGRASVGATRGRPRKVALLQGLYFLAGGDVDPASQPQPVQTLVFDRMADQAYQCVLLGSFWSERRGVPLSQMDNDICPIPRIYEDCLLRLAEAIVYEQVDSTPRQHLRDIALAQARQIKNSQGSNFLPEFTIPEVHPLPL